MRLQGNFDIDHFWEKKGQACTKRVKPIAQTVSTLPASIISREIPATAFKDMQKPEIMFKSTAFRCNKSIDGTVAVCGPKDARNLIASRENRL